MGSGIAGVLKVLERLGYVQIDTISVVERAHDHTVWTRASGFEHRHFNTLIKRGDAFEYWFHAASYLPMRDFRFSLPRKNAIRAREGYRGHDPKLVSHVLDRIRAEGPLFARDFESPPRNSRGWWDWKPAKRALETLYMQGDLMVAARHGFAKLYDLTENVLPADVPLTQPTTFELAEHLIERALQAHGFATPQLITHLRSGTPLRSAIAGILDARVHAGQLVRFDVGPRTCFADPATLDRIGRPAPAVRILSPFDNSVIHRERGQSVFDFDYTLECYLPQPKRRWGYFSLPILYRDSFVGRMDCKAHRDTDRFEIKALFIESDLDDAFAAAFRSGVAEYAAFAGCPDVHVTYARPKHFENLFN